MARRTPARTHVVPHAYGWAIKRGGKTEYHFANKRAAVAKAKRLASARGIGLVVHGRDGRVQQHLSPRLRS